MFSSPPSNGVIVFGVVAIGSDADAATGDSLVRTNFPSVAAGETDSAVSRSRPRHGATTLVVTVKLDPTDRLR